MLGIRKKIRIYKLINRPIVYKHFKNFANNISRLIEWSFKHKDLWWYFPGIPSNTYCKDWSTNIYETLEKVLQNHCHDQTLQRNQNNSAIFSRKESSSRATWGIKIRVLRTKFSDYVNINSELLKNNERTADLPSLKTMITLMLSAAEDNTLGLLNNKKPANLHSLKTMTTLTLSAVEDNTSGLLNNKKQQICIHWKQRQR